MLWSCVMIIFVVFGDPVFWDFFVQFCGTVLATLLIPIIIDSSVQNLLKSPKILVTNHCESCKVIGTLHVWCKVAGVVVGNTFPIKVADWNRPYPTSWIVVGFGRLPLWGRGPLMTDMVYLKGRIFCGKKFLRNLFLRNLFLRFCPWSAKINSAKFTIFSVFIRKNFFPQKFLPLR